MSFENQLKSIDIKKLPMSNGMTLEQNLYLEAQKLKDCIQNRLNIYLKSNPPRMYKRTGGLQNSLTVDDILNIRIVGTSIEIDLFFNSDAYHTSGDGITTPQGENWQGNGEVVNTAYLLNYGYAVKKDVWFKNYKNFGFRKGGHFVEEGIADFNTMNKLGIRIAVKSNGYKV